LSRFETWVWNNHWLFPICAFVLIFHSFWLLLLIVQYGGKWFMGVFIRKLLANWKMWYPFHCFANYLSLFVVNDGAFINFHNPYVMRCVLCHSIAMTIDELTIWPMGRIWKDMWPM
jgi:hypothetical protein